MNQTNKQPSQNEIPEIFQSANSDQHFLIKKGNPNDPIYQTRICLNMEMRMILQEFIEQKPEEAKAFIESGELKQMFLDLSEKVHKCIWDLYDWNQNSNSVIKLTIDAAEREGFRELRRVLGLL